MRILIKKQPKRRASFNLTRSNKTRSEVTHHADPILYLQRTTGNKAVQRLLLTQHTRAGYHHFLSRGTEKIIQRALDPSMIDPLGRLLGQQAQSPQPTQPATPPQAQLILPQSVEQEVLTVFQTVVARPQRYEPDFINILLAPRYDRDRITINFFIHHFSSSFRIVDRGLRDAIRDQLPPEVNVEDIYDQVWAQFAETFFDLARQYRDQSPRFRRRLNIEQRRRRQRRPISVPPGAEIV